MPAITPTYSIIEPHPTVPQNSLMHSGRGGLGNFFRAPATTSPSGVPTPADTSSSSSSTNDTSSSSRRAFYSGRGGAGNAHAAAERPVLSFDEEYTRAEARERTATAGYVGRGGAGNYVKKNRSGSGSGSDVDVDGESITRVNTSSTTSSMGSLRSVWSRIASSSRGE